MPRLRPIDFTNFDDSQGQRMIKDILMKYPRGPQQNQRREDYEPFDYGNKVCLSRVLEAAQADHEMPEPGYLFTRHVEQEVAAGKFGYTPEQVYTFFIWFFQGNRPQHWTLRDQLEIHCPEFGKAKLTRGAGRIHERLWVSWNKAAAALNVQKMFRFAVSTPNAPGEERNYYSRRDAWGCDVSMVAPDQETARQMVLAVYGHCIDREEVRLRDTVDWKNSDECDAVVANQNSINKAANRIAHWQAEIEKLKQKIANVEFLKESIELYSVTAFEGE